jgi:hypothetical protein
MIMITCLIPLSVCAYSTWQDTCCSESGATNALADNKADWSWITCGPLGSQSMRVYFNSEAEFRVVGGYKISSAASLGC